MSGKKEPHFLGLNLRSFQFWRESSAQQAEIRRVPPSSSVSRQRAYEVVNLSAPRDTDEMPSPKITNIADMLAQRLREHEGEIIRPEFQWKGTEAIVRSMETLPDGFFEAVQAKRPNGLFVGVGVGTSIAVMVNSFSENNPPIGALFIDAHPRVVAVGKVLVNAEKRYDNPLDCVASFMTSKEQFLTKIAEVIEMEEDLVLQHHFQGIPSEEWQNLYQVIEQTGLTAAGLQAHRYTRGFVEGEYIDVVGEFVKGYKLQRYLALNNNIAFLYADFRDPIVIDAITSLPLYRQKRPVVYLANMHDYVSDDGADPENVSGFEVLQRYENGVNPTIFIDYSRSLEYFLRASERAPRYIPADVEARHFLSDCEAKPSGLIFPDAEPEALDLSGLSVEELRDRYQTLFIHSVYQEVKAFEESILGGGQTFEEKIVPAIANVLRLAREDPEWERKRYWHGARDALMHRYFSEAVIQMGAVYEEMVRRVLDTKGVDMWGKPMQQVMEAL